MDRSNSQSDLPNKRARQQSDQGGGKQIVINELLCYASKKYHQLKKQILKQTIYDFYQSETVIEAKNQLCGDIEALAITDWPKPPRRRLNSTEHIGAKMKNDIEDITNMLDYIDRSQLTPRLPLYVATDLDLLPSPKLTEGDLQCVLIRLHELTNKVHELSDSLTTTNRTMAEMSTCMSAAAAAATHATTSVTTSHQHDASRHQPDPPPSQPKPVRRVAGANADTDTADEGALSEDWDADPAVQTVNRRRNKQPKNARPTPAQGTTTYATALTQNLPVNNPPQARRTVLGTAQSASLKAAKHLQIKKAVYKISNIDAVYTAENLIDHLTEMGVRVADDSQTHGKSCFELKPGPRQPIDNKCFRVCIFAADKQKLLVKEKWSSGILIQEWIFRKNDTPENQKDTESSAASNQHAADQPSAAMNEQIGEPT